MRVVQIGVGGFGRRWAGVVHGSDGSRADRGRGSWTKRRGAGRPRTWGWRRAIAWPVSTRRLPATIGRRRSLSPRPRRTTRSPRPPCGPANTCCSRSRWRRPWRRPGIWSRPPPTCGRTLMVSQNYRFRRPARTVQEPGRRRARSAICWPSRSPAAGIRGLTFPPGDFRYRMRHPYVLDMAIHHLDLLRALTGRDVERVFARSWRVPDSPYLHDPAVIAVMTLEGGGSRRLRGRLGCPRAGRPRGTASGS